MAIVKTTDINVTPRVIDFVSQFNTNIERLFAVMGVSNMVVRPAGADVKVKTAVVPSLASSPAEGEAITPTSASVTEASLGSIVIEKYCIGATVEAISQYGYDDAIRRVDEAFFNKQRAAILGKFYTFLATGTLSCSATGFQATLAAAIGKVKNYFLSNDLSYTGTVAFVNINDFYAYLGGASITVQSEFGMFYIQNFLGAEIVILCDDSCVTSGKMYVTAINNLIAYHINPSDAAFSQADIPYYTEASGVIGAAGVPDYSTASSKLYTIYGITLAAEYLGGICVGTIN